MECLTPAHECLQLYNMGGPWAHACSELHVLHAGQAAREQLECPLSPVLQAKLPWWQEALAWSSECICMLQLCRNCLPAAGTVGGSPGQLLCPSDSHRSQPSVWRGFQSRAGCFSGARAASCPPSSCKHWPSPVDMAPLCAQHYDSSPPPVL